jgi:hypothetical protein
MSNIRIFGLSERLREIRTFQIVNIKKHIIRSLKMCISFFFFFLSLVLGMLLRLALNSWAQRVEANACNPSTQRLRQEDCQFEASLGYVASSRPAWATQGGHPVSNKKQNKTPGHKQSSCFSILE